MDFLNVAVIALVQGITEFLPVSSSGHLMLIPLFTGWDDQGLSIDIAAHFGTLLAVMLYFRKDIWEIAHGFLQPLLGRPSDAEARHGRHLFYCVVVATLPIVVVGGVLGVKGVEELTRHAELVALTSILFGVFLFIADRFFPTDKTLASITLLQAFLIGALQVITLIPGASRSGITMTGARFLGFRRTEAAHFSMLLSIPTISAAALLAGLEIYETGDAILWGDAALTACLSFVAAYVTIALFLRWLKHASMTVFVVYRMLLGAFILWFVS